MWKWSRICILSEGAVREKTYFPEKAEMRYTLAGCSRMRVGEGSSERKKIEKMIKIVLKTSKNRYWKRDVKNMKKSSKKHPKKEVKMKKKSIKSQCGKRDVRTTKRPGTGLPPLGPGGLPINKIVNKLTEEKQKYFPWWGWCAEEMREGELRIRRPRRILTRLGASGPGADLSCQRQRVRSGP